MPENTALEKYLNRIATGDFDRVEELIVHLADAILCVPSLESPDDLDISGPSKIRLATFSRDGKKLVPCFTTSEKFERWSSGKYHCLKVAGADLAITFPETTWMILNAGHPSMLEVSPDQLRDVSQVDSSTLTTAWKDIPYRHAINSSLREQESDATLLFPPDDFSVLKDNSFSEEYEDSFEFESAASSPEVDARVLTSRLTAIFADFPEVEESYMQTDIDDEWSKAVVGLLTSRLDAERRFTLIAEIAELSQQLYGAAGAIEVFDDLDVRSSRSWDLFNALTPFYVKSDSEIYGSLTDELEKAKLESDADFDQELNSWSDVKRTGSKIFSALRGVFKS